MKHLLILISFLLLSSPVIGDNHKSETLYGWGKYPDLFGKDLEIKKLTQHMKVMLRMVNLVVLVFLITLMEVSL